MDRKELYKQLSEMEKKVESARTKRAIKTIMAFAVAIFLILYFTGRPTGFEILGDFLAAIFLAGILFLINAIIFGQLFRVSESERIMLENLKKKLSDAEDT